MSAAVVYVLAVVFSIFEPIRCQSLLIAFIAASVPLLPALQKVSDKRIEISDPRR